MWRYWAEVRRVRLLRLAVVLCVFPAVTRLQHGSADWPQWRYDAGRSAASPEELPAELHLQWARDFGLPKPAWPEEPAVLFDTTYQPVVAGKTMFVPSMVSDSVTALDVDTGAVKWRFYANGPVRLAPVAADSKVYFGSDDGCFYCLDAADGGLMWKIEGHSRRKVVGNGRLISVWPVRGAPALVDDHIYFTTGVWPFEGQFLYSVDISNDVGPAGAPHPRYEVAFLDTERSVQGYLAATVGGSRLFLPGGRAAAVCVDRFTGRVTDLQYLRGRFGPGWHVAGLGEWLFHGADVYRISGFASPSALRVGSPVLASNIAYAAQLDSHGSRAGVVAIDTSDAVLADFEDRQGRKAKLWTMPELWRCDISSVTNLISAGKRLYAVRGHSVFAIDPPEADRSARASALVQVEGDPESILVADGRLFVVTDEGSIHCFGAQKQEPVLYRSEESALPPVDHEWQQKAGRLLEALGPTDADGGYCLALGIGTGKLLDELIRHSHLHIIAVDPDAAKVDVTRRRLDAAGMYGDRVAVHTGQPVELGLPPYLASLVVSEDLDAAGIEQGSSFVETVFQWLRPYGGAACLEVTADTHARIAQQVARGQLPNAEFRRTQGLTVLKRVGPLPGSGDWTHLFADAGNTLFSRDQLVKGPLGVLWFGGPAACDDLFFDRHSMPPSPEVLGGRMFIQGAGKLTAVDVYTGRLLWQIGITETDLPSGYEMGDTPYRRAFLPHHNLAVASDAVYVIYPERCDRHDPETGERISEFKLPWAEVGQVQGSMHTWNVWELRVWKDLLVVSLSHPAGEKVPSGIIVMDRYSGRVLWSQREIGCFSQVAVGGEKVFSTRAESQQDGRMTGYYLQALDVRTGTVLWSTKANERLRGPLAYSEEGDVTVASSPYGILACRGADGATLWSRDVKGRGFGGHASWVVKNVIVAPDRVLDQRGPGLAYDLLTGTQATQLHPVTGKPVPWEFIRKGHHCNYAVASEHLITFRAETAAYFDVYSYGTHHLRGFRGGCRNSLIPANGVLNAPNFAHGCTCDYPDFTSLALVPVPDVEMWTYNTLKYDESQIQRVGINFGAPGHRRADNGALWLKYPYLGGPAVPIAVDITPENPEWNEHRYSEGDYEAAHWVTASSCEGLRTMTLRLGKEASSAGPYTVRLYFIEPNDRAKPGERVFSVSLQGREVLKDLDILKEAGEPHHEVVKEFKDIAMEGVLTVDLEAARGKALLGGVELLNPLEADVSRALHVGINLGGFGDRREFRGALWLDYPEAGPAVKVTPRFPDWICRHSLQVRGELPWVAASAGEGLSCVQVTLGRNDSTPCSYTIRLYFAELDTDAKPGDRVFTVSLQGKKVLENFDIVGETGWANQSVMKEFTGVQVADVLAVELTPLAGAPVICGIEALSETR